MDPNLENVETLDVASVRLDWHGPGGFGLSGEYVDESSSQADATGFYGQISYAPQNTRWSPALSYRYASFDGDDPATEDDELFREIAYGFTDWGSWYQGEITGEYVFGNGNLNSNLVRLKMQPQEGSRSTSSITTSRSISRRASVSRATIGVTKSTSLSTGRSTTTSSWAFLLRCSRARAPSSGSAARTGCIRCCT